MGWLKCLAIYLGFVALLCLLFVAGLLYLTGCMVAQMRRGEA